MPSSPQPSTGASPEAPVDCVASYPRAMTMTTADQVREQLLVLLDGVGAHMPFDEAVADFPTDAINAFPPNVDYTPWHLLEHLRITQADILDYIVNPDYVGIDWPALLPMYERLYDGRAYVTRDVVEPVRRRVRALSLEHGVADRRSRPLRPSSADLVVAEQLSLAGFLGPGTPPQP